MNMKKVALAKIENFIVILMSALTRSAIVLAIDRSTPLALIGQICRLIFLGTCVSVASMRFSSAFTVGSKLSNRSWEKVRDEPMLFDCSGLAAFDLGGPITREFIAKLGLELFKMGKGLDDVVFDSRVHMLKPGWYPCIPGFHHDDVPRLSEDGQPWYEEYRGPHPELYRSQHCLAIVGDDICRTEFAVGEADFTIPAPGNILYKVWHKEVTELIDLGELKKASAPMNRLVFFDDRAWHQGTPSVGDGWRWFGRASWNTGRRRKCTNQIRTQVQVYLEHPMEGW